MTNTSKRIRKRLDELPLLFRFNRSLVIIDTHPFHGVSKWDASADSQTCEDGSRSTQSSMTSNLHDFA